MSREEFMEIVYDELHSDGDNCRADRIIDAADNYAEERTRWIPVTEHLPEEDGEYFVTWTTSRSKRPLLEICEYSCGEWDIDNGSAYSDAEVIAWMPLPECYKS